MFVPIPCFPTHKSQASYIRPISCLTDILDATQCYLQASFPNNHSVLSSLLLNPPRLTSRLMEFLCLTSLLMKCAPDATVSGRAGRWSTARRTASSSATTAWRCRACSGETEASTCVSASTARARARATPSSSTSSVSTDQWCQF